MNIACNEDSGFDIVCAKLIDDQTHINFRFNKDDTEDININYVFTVDELITFRDVLTELIGT